jgi:hypothetical protein
MIEQHYAGVITNWAAELVDGRARSKVGSVAPASAAPVRQNREGATQEWSASANPGRVLAAIAIASAAIPDALQSQASVLQ